MAASTLVALTKGAADTYRKTRNDYDRGLRNGFASAVWVVKHLKP